MTSDAPVGTMILWMPTPGTPIPPGWQPADGQAVLAADYPTLDRLFPYVRPPWHRWWRDGIARRRKYGGNRRLVGLPNMAQGHYQGLGAAPVYLIRVGER
jgi:hypothetical protein